MSNESIQRDQVACTKVGQRRRWTVAESLIEEDEGVERRRVLTATCGLNWHWDFTGGSVLGQAPSQYSMYDGLRSWWWQIGDGSFVQWRGERNGKEREIEREERDYHVHACIIILITKSIMIFQFTTHIFLNNQPTLQRIIHKQVILEPSLQPNISLIRTKLKSPLLILLIATKISLRVKY